MDAKNMNAQNKHIVNTSKDTPKSKNIQSPLSKSASLQSLININQLDVFIKDNLVGTLALTSNGTTAFEYSNEWLANGFSISPLSLPLEKRVFVAKQHPLEGLFGVFDDSLPDGWGRLLVDRFLQEQGIDPLEISPLTRLAIVGTSGMGALEYHPHFSFATTAAEKSFDELAAECTKILATNFSDDLDTLFTLGGSSGGARPKVFTTIDGEDWIVKFPSSYDPINIGAQEYTIACTAGKAGIEMPEVRLMSSSRCEGYFAIKRFDRNVHANKLLISKLHMISAGALLETSHRIPNLDYDLLMKLTLRLTESMEQVEAMYRLMAFNVFIGNRDDHSKNFSFLRALNSEDNSETRWRLAPGYDLTSNSGMNGEHTTTVNGKGKGITMADIVKVGERAGIKKSQAQTIAESIREIVNDSLHSVVALPRIN